MFYVVVGLLEGGFDGVVWVRKYSRASVLPRAKAELANSDKYNHGEQGEKPIHETKRRSMEIGVERAVDDEHYAEQRKGHCSP